MNAATDRAPPSVAKDSGPLTSSAAMKSLQELRDLISVPDTAVSKGSATENSQPVSNTDGRYRQTLRARRTLAETQIHVGYSQRLRKQYTAVLGSSHTPIMEENSDNQQDSMAAIKGPDPAGFRTALRTALERVQARNAAAQALSGNVPDHRDKLYGNSDNEAGPSVPKHEGSTRYAPPSVETSTAPPQNLTDSNARLSLSCMYASFHLGFFLHGIKHCPFCEGFLDPKVWERMNERPTVERMGLAPAAVAAYRETAEWPVRTAESDLITRHPLRQPDPYDSTDAYKIFAEYLAKSRDN